jgi:hypothetical protein
MKSKAIIRFIIILALFCCPSLSNAQNWLPLDKGIGFPYATINHLMADTTSNLIYASGSFTTDGNNNPLRGITKWDGTKWDSVGNVHIGNGSKFGICKYKDTVLLSGRFYSSLLPSQLAKWDGIKWDTIMHTDNLDVNCFLEKNGILYFGGYFNKCGNDSTFSLGKYNGSTFSGLSPCYEINNAIICCMAFFQDTLYVGGNFYLFPLLPIAGLAKWDGFNLVPVNSEFINSQCTIEAMTVYRNELYIGGYFTKASGFTGDFIMKWDGHQFYEVGGGTNQRVTCMKVYNDELYVGGWFTEVGGVSCKNIAKWDGSQWTILNNDDFDEFYCIRDICIYKDELYIAGTFRTIGGDSINNVAKYNHPLSSVNSLSENENSLFIFPNPFQSAATVELPYDLEDGTLLIYDIIGKEVKRIENLQGKEISISGEGLVNGMYFFKVIDGNTNVGQGKMVVE